MSSKISILTVSDLHGSRTLCELLREAVRLHRPDVLAFVGDVLDASSGRRDKIPVEECARILSRLDCPEILFVRGNHEDSNWCDFATEWEKARRLHALHGEAFVHGPLVVIGFPCFLGTEDAFIGQRPPLPIDPDAWLPSVIRPFGQAARTLWLMHEPPAGTPLSQPGGPLAGNVEWVQAIERFEPWLTVSGHDHWAPLQNKCWHHRVGRTSCVNVGQSSSGPLHYCVIDAEFSTSNSSEPDRMRVSAFPMNESVQLPWGGLTAR